MRKTFEALGDDPGGRRPARVADRRQARAVRGGSRGPRARQAGRAVRRGREAAAGHPRRSPGRGRRAGADPRLGRHVDVGARALRRGPAGPARARPDGRGPRRLARHLAAARRGGPARRCSDARRAGRRAVSSCAGRGRASRCCSSTGPRTTTGRSRKGRLEAGETARSAPCARSRRRRASAVRSGASSSRRRTRTERAAEDGALLGDGGRRRASCASTTRSTRRRGCHPTTPSALLSYERDNDVLRTRAACGLYVNDTTPYERARECGRHVLNHTSA